jgi:hypothetical protein
MSKEIVAVSSTAAVIGRFINYAFFYVGRYNQHKIGFGLVGLVWLVWFGNAR